MTFLVSRFFTACDEILYEWMHRFFFFYKKSLKKKYSKLWLDIFKYQRVLYKRNRRRMHAGIRFDPPTNRQRYFLSILYTSPATLIHERFERGRSRRIIIFVNATLCPASIEAFLASDGFKTTCFETCLWDFKMLRLWRGREEAKHRYAKQVSALIRAMGLTDSRSWTRFISQYNNIIWMSLL